MNIHSIPKPTPTTPDRINADTLSRDIGDASLLIEVLLEQLWGLSTDADPDRLLRSISRCTVTAEAARDKLNLLEEMISLDYRRISDALGRAEA